MDEMKSFIGLIINMGILKLTNIKEYWYTHITIYQLTILSWCLLLGQGFANLLDAACGDLISTVQQNDLIPSRELSIDEAVK